MIAGAEGADPASVVYDAVNAAKARHADILLCDTAGRLHNKKNLMNELEKIGRIISREYPEAKRENLVVLDAATGQNALSQAREFSQVTNLTGIVLTKMDGSSKGGIAIAVQSELGIPVKYIGVGEHLEDLQRFDPDEFVRALFDTEPEEAADLETSKSGEGDGPERETGSSPAESREAPDERESAETSSKAAEPEKEDDEEDPWAFFASMQDAKNGR